MFLSSLAKKRTGKMAISAVIVILSNLIFFMPQQSFFNPNSTSEASINVCFPVEAASVPVLNINKFENVEICHSLLIHRDTIDNAILSNSEKLNEVADSRINLSFESFLISQFSTST